MQAPLSNKDVYPAALQPTAVVIVMVSFQIQQEVDEATSGQKSKPSVVLFTNKLFSDINEDKEVRR